MLGQKALRFEKISDQFICFIRLDDSGAGVVNATL